MTWVGQREAFDAAVRAGAPGARWPLRDTVRRFAWHVLDHAWEIEDKRPVGEAAPGATWGVGDSGVTQQDGVDLLALYDTALPQVCAPASWRSSRLLRLLDPAPRPLEDP